MSDKVELDKTFKLSNESLSNFLRDIADSLEEDKTINLDGSDWKLTQPLEDDEEKILRVIKDEQGLEISFKIK